MAMSILSSRIAFFRADVRRESVQVKDNTIVKRRDSGPAAVYRPPGRRRLSVIRGDMVVKGRIGPAAVYRPPGRRRLSVIEETGAGRNSINEGRVGPAAVYRPPGRR